ncbi:MAG: PQQ-dependent sugar dehydrogenase, partial [Promethearchaeota archaeon]
MKKHFKIILIISIIFLSGLGIIIGWNYLNKEKPEYPYEVTLAFPNISFEYPVGIYEPGDGTNRLFVVDDIGIIYVFQNNKNVTEKTIFLDIRDKVLFKGEMGLLGLAFHPDYEINGLFYVNYIADNPRRTIISRFKVNSTDLNKANVSSELLILNITQPFSNHNGGQLAFGADGYLYIALGDGGGKGDPYGNAQNLSTLLGSILRIDIDSGDPYNIPFDNPFVGTIYREEIYAYGLRNPWRFSFDTITGWLWAADNGQQSWEEIDLIEKGKNYGWNIMEGKHSYKPPLFCDSTGLELPIYEYSHDRGHSIIGGFVYRG